jgi:CRP/FNR family transcriptional regulator, cyclic AMP receptor protein
VIQAGEGNPMSNTMVAERNFVSPFRSSTNMQKKPRTPYGLPIEDNCVTCPDRNANYFCCFSEASTKALEQIKRVTSYPEGAVLFMEGETSRGVYILCQGRVKLLTTNSEGKSFILKIAQPGEVFGLNSILSGTPHEITAETLQPCRVAYVGREDFLRFIKEHGDACLHVAKHLSRDCSSAYEVIRSIGLNNSASEKLARFLVEWASDGRMNEGAIRVKLALTHDEMAQLIGSSRETVSRTLSEFKRQRWIELNGATLVLRNKAALEQLAAN